MKRPIKEKIMQGIKIAIALILAVVMLASVIMTNVSAAEEKKELTIVFTHDLHSHIDVAEQGGFARIMSTISKIKADDPNALVVDAGDFSMGTLYQTVFATHALELRLMGQMGFDATTFGNHEFDYTTEKLAKMLDAAKGSGDPLPALLVANIDWEASEGEYTQMLKKAMEAYGSKPYTVITKGDVKIGLFGVMGEDSADDAPTSGLVFTDISECAKEVVAEMKAKENPDVIVCLSHSGTNSNPAKSEDEILAKNVPEIDVIISGHTHTLLPEGIQVGNTFIGSTGEYGKQIGTMTLKQNSNGRWTVYTYELLTMDETVEEDATLKAVIDSYQPYLQEYVGRFGYESADQVLAENPYTFEGSTLHQDNALGNLISDAYLYALKQAEGEAYEDAIAVVPVGIIRATLNQGQVTVANAFEISCMGIGEDEISGFPLVNCYLTGAELKTLAEVDASVSDLMPAAQLHCAGLQYTFNPNRLILNRVTDVKLTYTDEEIEDDKLYRVVAGMYSAQMLETVNSKSFGLMSLTPKDKNGEAITDFSKHIIYDKNGNELKEWYALATYLESFEKNEEGISRVPAKYQQPAGRIISVDDTSLGALLEKPNKVFFLVAGVILVVLLLLFLLIFFIIRIVKKHCKKIKKEGDL